MGGTLEEGRVWVDRLGLAVMGVGKVGSWGGTYARGSGTTRDTHGSRGDEGYKIVRVVGWTATAAWLKAAGLERIWYGWLVVGDRLSLAVWCGEGVEVRVWR